LTNRRQFIQAGLTLSSLSLSEFSAIRMAVASPQGAYLNLENFVADRRYSQSMTAASKLASAGVPIVEVSGDVTDLWVDKYSVQWKHRTMTLAGVTGSDVLFVLETLAPDYGMRVIHKQTLDTGSLPTDETLLEVISWFIAPKQVAKAVL